MTSTILTFVAEVIPDRREALNAALARLRETSAVPPHPPFSDLPSLHFASLVVFDTPGFDSVLVFENNFDGDLDAFLPELLGSAAPEIHGLFRCCVDYTAASEGDVKTIERYLLRHVIRPAAYHVGNVGRSRIRIGRESALWAELNTRVDDQLNKGVRPPTSDAAYELLRAQVPANGAFQWITEPHERQTRWERLAPGLRLGLTVVVLALLFLASAWTMPVPTLGLLGLLILTLLLHEATDKPMDPSELDPNHVRRVASGEDQRVQNHLASMTVVKPGPFRRTLLWLVLSGANLVARTSTKGELSGIPSIHYAHWSLLDGGRRLLFLSNFDGSWESYLDDFIDKASPGLTGIWTNAVGFPRTWLLVLAGSRDGVTFKAFARKSQTPAAVWYSAYPDLTVQQVDKQSTLREGIARRPAPADLAAWLRTLG